MGALVWLRDDLRCHDQPALSRALNEHDNVTAIVILSRQQYPDNRFKRSYRIAKLIALCDELGHLGVKLSISYVDNYDQQVDHIIEIAVSLAATIYCCRQMGVDERKRDELLSRRYPSIQFYQADTIAPLGSITTATGTMYKVFTPFKRRWLAAVNAEAIQSIPVSSARQRYPISNNDTKERLKSWLNLSPLFELEIRENLDRYIYNQLEKYADDRDYPSLDAGSKLSPLLAIGAISPAMIVSRINDLKPGAIINDEGAKVFLSEIIWREFYRHLMHAYPHVSRNLNFQRDTQDLQWQNDKKLFKKWCDGQTGFPIVDAAMRCLNSTGLMHNRLRMVVASFLCKDLLIDWRWGERYFMKHLGDADFASNNGGWQWAASTGADAAPYFRIFNPNRQSERFDKHAEFIFAWVPELKGVNTKFIHNPDKIDHITTGYPEPCVNHKIQKERALEMFKKLTQ